jgi:hypothetical protein
MAPIGDLCVQFEELVRQRQFSSLKTVVMSVSSDHLDSTYGEMVAGLKPLMDRGVLSIDDGRSTLVHNRWK